MFFSLCRGYFAVINIFKNSREGLISATPLPDTFGKICLSRLYVQEKVCQRVYDYAEFIKDIFEVSFSQIYLKRGRHAPIITHLYCIFLTQTF